MKKTKKYKMGGGMSMTKDEDQMYKNGGKLKKKMAKKKRYGGSVSYSSSSVKGYSKTYAGMGGDDE